MFPIVPGLNLTVVKWAVIALAAIGLSLTLYTHGRHVAQGEVAAAQRDIALAYAAEIVSQQATADQLATALATQRAAQAPQDRIIKQEVIRYVTHTPPADRCLLPGPWRLLHDAAATGQPPAPQAGPLATRTADPIADTTALETIESNYAACRTDQAKLEGWQRRYRALEQQ